MRLWQFLLKLLFNVALAACALLTVVRAADLYLVQSAVAAVVIIPAHIYVAGNAEIDIFHNTSKMAHTAHTAGNAVIILPIKLRFIPALVDKKPILF